MEALDVAEFSAEVLPRSIGQVVGRDHRGGHPHPIELTLAFEVIAPGRVVVPLGHVIGASRTGGAHDITRLVKLEADHHLAPGRLSADLEGVLATIAPGQLAIDERQVRQPGQLGEVADELHGQHLGTGTTADRLEAPQLGATPALAVGVAVGGDGPDAEHDTETSAPLERQRSRAVGGLGTETEPSPGGLQ